MADDNDKIVTLMYMKEQVERWAAKKLHRHTVDDISDISSKYATFKHDSPSNQHGEGTSTNYGHVKVDTNVTEASVNPVQSKGIYNAIHSAIDTLIGNLQSTFQKRLWIVDEALEEWEFNDTIAVDGQSLYAVPTAKLVYNAIINYKDMLRGRSWDMPKEIDMSLDNMITAGYYYQTGHRYFSYGGEVIYYTNGIIRIERYKTNRIIQHVYSTSNGSGSFKLNGSEYTRWGILENHVVTWQPWHIAHKPYTQTTRVINYGTGVDYGSVSLFENTAGFIIHWDQTQQPNDRYPVTAKLYEYSTVCEFSPPLPIRGPYVYGNLIGRFDIKITSDKMQIRSNVPPGGRISEMHETYFVPRNQ